MTTALKLDSAVPLTLLAQAQAQFQPREALPPAIVVHPLSFPDKLEVKVSL